MTDAVKLLTETEANKLYRYGPVAFVAELRERGLIAPEPTCPLLIEAREIAAKACEDNGHPETGEYMRSVDPTNSTTLAAALAALKRGMEMRPPLTREMVRIAYHTAQVGMDNTNFIDRLHAALVKQMEQS